MPIEYIKEDFTLDDLRHDVDEIVSLSQDELYTILNHYAVNEWKDKFKFILTVRPDLFFTEKLVDAYILTIQQNKPKMAIWMFENLKEHLHMNYYLFEVFLWKKMYNYIEYFCDKQPDFVIEYEPNLFYIFFKACSEENLGLAKCMTKICPVIFKKTENNVKYGIQYTIGAVIKHKKFVIADWLLDNCPFDLTKYFLKISSINPEIVTLNWIHTKQPTIENNKENMLTSFYHICLNGNRQVINWFYTKIKIDIHSENEWLFRELCKYGKYIIVRHIYDMVQNIVIDTNEDDAFRGSCQNNQLTTAMWLCTLINNQGISKKYDIHNVNGELHAIISVYCFICKRKLNLSSTRNNYEKCLECYKKPPVYSRVSNKT